MDDKVVHGKKKPSPIKPRKLTVDAALATRREFIRTVAGAGLALAGSSVAAWADHHGHPTPNSISYLDRRMYIRNMELLSQVLGHGRNGKMQMMSVGNFRYIFQQGDVIDVSDVRKPVIYNKGGFDGYQVQVAYNKNLKKWILMTGAQTPITDSTPEAPMGKYDDPHLDDKRKNYKGLRGVRFYDCADPSKIVKLSEFSTGATGQGTHRNYYDGGKYAYLDTAPDETFIHQPSYFRQLINGNMIIDASDPASAKQVSMWWVPGSRKGEEAEYNKWIWSKLVPPKVVADQTPFAGLHGPVYVPKKLEDGGNRGYGAFGCNGAFLAHAKFMDPPLEVVRIPFEGSEMVGYLRLPKNAKGPVPVVIAISGLDSRKEDLSENFGAVIPSGIGFIGIDSPGTGQAPIKASENAERMFSRVIDFLQTRPEVDKARIGMDGQSFGAYWATKLAIIEHARLKAVVAQSPPADATFARDFVINKTLGNREYLFGLAPALMSIHDGAKTVDDLATILPKMSLVKQGLLGKPTAPMLIIAGALDTQVPVSDAYLILNSGDVPKEAWINPQGGHLGRQVKVWPDPVIFREVIIPWLVRKLGAETLK